MYRIKQISNGMLAALILSIVIAFMISLIPTIQFSQLNKGFPVFNLEKEIFLTENNLVDFISLVKLEMPLKKVKLNYDILAVDLEIEIENYIDTSIIYKDLFIIIQKSFVQTTNVKEVLLRVFVDDKVFIAISANRDDIADNPYMDFDSSMVYKDFLEQYFGINYGKTFKQN